MEETDLGNKYHRYIQGLDGEYIGIVDVYCVLDAYDISNSAIQHAVKKLLCAGLRGHKDRIQDLKEAIVSVERALTLETGKSRNEKQPDHRNQNPKLSGSRKSGH